MSYDKKEYMANYQRKRKALGLCVRCGKKNDRSDRVICSKCYERSKADAKARRDFLASLGICVSCGKEKTTGGKKHCEKCCEKMRNYLKKRKQ